MFFFFADFVTVYIRIIIDFNELFICFSLTTTWSRAQQITKVWKSIFSTVLVMLSKMKLRKN